LHCQVTQDQIVSSFPKGRNSESELTGEGNGAKAMLLADSRPSPEERMLEARTRSATPQADERSPTPQFIPTSSSASDYSQIHTRAGGRSASLESLHVMGSNFGRPDGSGPLQGLSALQLPIVRCQSCGANRACAHGCAHGLALAPSARAAAAVLFLSCAVARTCSCPASRTHAGVQSALPVRKALKSLQSVAYPTFHPGLNLRSAIASRC
jgi:hypothetical protein